MSKKNKITIVILLLIVALLIFVPLFALKIAEFG